ncbi:hypothetical protein BC835DRAFT_1392322 [Cytidiella melzeri]|nr:hypothetical protein BC835DRAFT_1392322 [Cytidiella melzeri]
MTHAMSCILSLYLVFVTQGWDTTRVFLTINSLRTSLLRLSRGLVYYIFGERSLWFTLRNLLITISMLIPTDSTRHVHQKHEVVLPVDCIPCCRILTNSHSNLCWRRDVKAYDDEPNTRIPRLLTQIYWKLLSTHISPGLTRVAALYMLHRRPLPVPGVVACYNFTVTMTRRTAAASSPHKNTYNTTLLLAEKHLSSF